MKFTNKIFGIVIILTGLAYLSMIPLHLLGVIEMSNFCICTSLVWSAVCMWSIGVTMFTLNDEKKNKKKDKE